MIEILLEERVEGFLRSWGGRSVSLDGRAEGLGENERGEVVAAIGAVEAFGQHNYPCARFSCFAHFFLCMEEIRRFVGACVCVISILHRRVGLKRTRC